MTKKSSQLIHLLLLFTYKYSIKKWDNAGLLDREIGYYRVMKDEGLQGASLMTYGEDDAAYASVVSPFTILPKIRFRNNLCYSLLVPFIHWSAFKLSHVIKSNQSEGAWTGLVTKLIWPKKLFVVRCGWVRTTEMMRLDQHLRGISLLWAIFVEYLTFRFSDMIFVPSLPDKEYIISTYGIHSAKIHILPTSIDTDIFTTSDGKRNWGAPNKIIAVGRQVEMKNLQSLILAVKEMNREIELILVGDGPYKPTLIKLAEREKVDVTFLPATPNRELPHYLRQSDIFVVPQLYGTGLSKVMREAMACGLITIGSNIQAHREVITDGVNGFLCEPDPRSIQICLERVLSMSSEQLMEVSIHARDDIVNKYSMRAIAKEELEILRSHLQ